MRIGRLTRRRAAGMTALLSLVVACSATWPEAAHGSSAGGAGIAQVTPFRAGQTATYLTGTMTLGTSKYVVQAMVGGFMCNPGKCPRQTEPFTGTAQAPPSLTARTLSGSCSLPWMAKVTGVGTYVCRVQVAGAGTWPVTLDVTATQAADPSGPINGVIANINCLVVSPLGGCSSFVPSFPGPLPAAVYIQVA